MSGIGASTHELEIAAVLRGKTAEQLAMAERERERLLAEADRVRLEIERFERIITGFDMLLEQSRGTDAAQQEIAPVAAAVPPEQLHAETSATTKLLKGPAAVAAVVREAGRDGLSADELAERMLERGWLSADLKDPRGAARVSFSRLKKLDPNFRSEDGRYFYDSGST